MADPSNAELERFLHGLRIHESGDSNANNPHTSASGFYQYTDPTWNNYQGYARAVDAPFEVQHQRAREDATRHFRRYGNWEQVAAHHFYPAWADDPSQWNQSPGHPSNPTVQQFVDSVMANRPEQDPGDPQMSQPPSEPEPDPQPEPEPEPQPSPSPTDTGSSDIDTGHPDTPSNEERNASLQPNLDPPMDTRITDAASQVNWLKVVRDNRGSHFLVDFRMGTRHPLLGPGSGQFAAATALYGDPVTRRSQLPAAWQAAQDRAFPNRDDILLDGRVGYQEGLEAVEFFGGPNAMEEVVAGQSPDPFTGEIVSNPQQITSGSGTQFDPVPSQDPISPEPRDRSKVDAFQRMRETLQRYDLESLGDWAWSAMQDGRTAAWIEAELPHREEFKNRFPAIHRMRDQGLTPVSADEHIQYESQVEQLSQSLGLPEEVYSKESISDMLVNRVDPRQLEQFGDFFQRLRKLGLAGGQTFTETTESVFGE